MPSRKRIAICLEYPLHQHGGVEVLVRELLVGLRSEFEIFLVSGDLPAALEDSPLRPCWSEHYSWPSVGAGREDGKKLAAWMVAHDVDLAHFHFGGTYQWRARSFFDCPIPIVAKAGVPCVSTNHGAFSIFECVGPLKPLWFKIASLPLFWPAKLYQVAHVKWEATVSQHDFRAVQRRFFPVRQRFIQIYHSRLDGTRALQSEKTKTILCLGTVGLRKGQVYLAEAFGQIARRFPDWKLVIAGRHAEKDTSEALSAIITKCQIGEQVEIMKDVPEDQAQRLLESAAIFAIPSLKEGLGLSLQEAMFAGAACVGSETGGITDLIEHERTGLLVPPTDVPLLSAALERLITEPALRASLSSVGRQSIVAKGMTYSQMIARHIKLYRNVMADGETASHSHAQLA